MVSLVWVLEQRVGCDLRILELREGRMSGPPRTRTTVRDNLDSIELASNFHGSHSFFLSIFASPVCFGLSPTPEKISKSFACTKESRQRKVHPESASDPARRGLRSGRSYSASLRWAHSNFIHEICPDSTPGARDASTGNTLSMERFIQTEDRWSTKG